MTTEMLAYCGLDCQRCPIYLATQHENKDVQAKMKAEIIELCKEHYGIDYQLKDITDCDGCKTDGDRLFSAGRNCPIRLCAREKNLESCAHCSEYVCGKLATFFRTEIAAKARLDAIRKNM